ncbi:MFS transporter [Nocardia puris]|nr:MFS transporter [Nocardia puris]MBF6366850.1 MFS transporter [Nocardia puris]MBF6460756.1 MFS transporter [Nocardia puris]
MPVFALLARDLGASAGAAGVIVALVGLGAVIGDLPAGRVVARFGERRSIIGGSALGAVGALCALFAPNPSVLAMGAALTCVSNAVWGLARQSYLAAAAPLAAAVAALGVVSSTGAALMFRYIPRFVPWPLPTGELVRG